MTQRKTYRKQIDVASDTTETTLAHLAVLRSIAGVKDVSVPEGLLAMRLAEVGLDGGTSESELWASIAFGYFGPDYSHMESDFGFH
jgi:hypothetical protein